MNDSPTIREACVMTGAELRALRRDLGWSQHALAQALGLKNRSQVCHLESGRTAIDGAKLAILTGLRERLAGGERPEPPTPLAPAAEPAPTTKKKKTPPAPAPVHPSPAEEGEASGRYVRKVRLALGLTQAAFAKRLGIGAD